MQDVCSLREGGGGRGIRANRKASTVLEGREPNPLPARARFPPSPSLSSATQVILERQTRPLECWLSSQLSTNTKIRIFIANIKFVLLYGSETLKTTKSLQNKLQVFVNCLRYILKTWWSNEITDGDLWRKTGHQEDITGVIRRESGTRFVSLSGKTQ